MKSKTLQDFYDSLKLASDPLLDIEESKKANMAYIYIQEAFRERNFLRIYDNQAGSSLGSPLTITCEIKDPFQITDTLKFEFLQEQDNNRAAAHYDPPNTIVLYTDLNFDTEEQFYNNLYNSIVENGDSITHEYTHHIDMNRMKDIGGYIGYLDKLEEQLSNSKDFKVLFNNTYWNLPHETNAYLLEGMSKIYQDIFVKLHSIERHPEEDKYLNPLRNIFQSFDDFSNKIATYVHPKFFMFTNEEVDKKIQKRLYKFYSFMKDIVQANLARFNLSL